jgi:hypothetical protein
MLPGPTSLAFGASSSFRHLAHVVSVRSEVKMFGIDTARVVAGMKH